VWRNDYIPTNGGEAQVNDIDCYLLVLTAKSDDQSYSRMVSTVRKTDLYPIQIDYYDHDGVLLKTLSMEDIRMIQDIPTAMRMTMSNHIDKTSTFMELVEINYGSGERTLKR
jgi:outer membrane lipoprotein-sorting protein